MGECKLTRRGKGETPEPPTGKTYLYNEGDECISLTGGWVARNVRYVVSGYSSTPTLTKNSNNMVAIAYYREGVITTNNPINLNGYSKIGIEVDYENLTQNSHYLHLDFLDSVTSPWNNHRLISDGDYSAIGSGTATNVTKTITFSSTNSLYPIFGMYAISEGSRYISITIKKVWLE